MNTDFAFSLRRALERDRLRWEHFCFAARSRFFSWPRDLTGKPSTTFPDRALGLACALIVASQAIAGSPDPAGARMWTAHADEDIVSLAYGLPESDDVPLSFVCDRASKTVVIAVQIEPVATPDPEILPIEISAGEGRVALVAKGTRTQLDDAFILEASTSVTPEFAKLFAGASKLSVLAEQKTSDFPLDEVARKGAEEIVKGCRA